MHETETPGFALTERAARRIAEIVAEAGAAAKLEAGAAAKPEAGAAPEPGAAPGARPQSAALRVAVLAGGCSGFQYRFELTDGPAPDDLVIARDGALVVVDPVSLDLLAGAELDYAEALMGSHFAVRNPNAASACGCGTSFAIA